MELDEDLGSWPQSFTQEHHGVYLFWHYLAVATATLPVAIASVVAAIALAAKKHRRAAIWTVGVMASVMVTTHGGQAARRAGAPGLGRPDPGARHASPIPSAHASAIVGAMGVAVVLTRMLVRRRAVRRLVFALALAMVLLVGADRIFLGVHNVSDVVAGYLLGGGMLLLWLALYDPTPRSIAAGQRPAHRGGPQLAQEARRHPQPGQDRRRGAVPAARREPGEGLRLHLGRLVGDHRRGHRSRHGARGRCQLAATSSSRSAGTAPSALSARSWPGPASPSGSSPPAPATCWRATSTSRSTCARRSTSR